VGIVYAGLEDEWIPEVVEGRVDLAEGGFHVTRVPLPQATFLGRSRGFGRGARPMLRSRQGT